jgi:hypothetical protein
MCPWEWKRRWCQGKNVPWEEGGFKEEMESGKRHFLGKRWAQGNDRAWEKMCPRGWIMDRDNVGSRKKWVGEMCPWEKKLGLRRRCGLRMKMGLRMVSWGKDGAEERESPGDGSLGRR